MNGLIIVGTFGHGKVVADIAALNGDRDIMFLDDDESEKDCAGWPVVGKRTEAPDREVLVAVGNPETRKRLMRLYSNSIQPVLIHPNAVVAENVKIGSGTVVMAGVVINLGMKVGKEVIVNTSSSINHDCSVGDYSHISVGVHLCGLWVGAGAMVINNVNICLSTAIGAGAVIHDIKEKGTYIRVPVKKMCKLILTGGYKPARIKPIIRIITPSVVDYSWR